MFDGQNTRMQSGGWQRTVILKLQQFELPAASYAQQVTAVVPTGKTEPDGGVQVIWSSLQLSVAVGAG